MTHNVTPCAEFICNRHAPAVVIDISERAAADPDTGLAPEDIDDWIDRHGTMPEGAVVIVRTGWAEKWPELRWMRSCDE